MFPTDVKWQNSFSPQTLTVKEKFQKKFLNGKGLGTFFLKLPKQ